MSLSHVKSKAIMTESETYFPGGVNSPVRAFASVGGTPLVFEKGSGKYLTDIDGNTYIDFCSSWGPLILGYSHPAVVEAVTKQAARAMTFGAPSTTELALAKKMRSWIPGLELIRFVSSGTEATMSAIRAARAATGRNKIVKFEGCYHGHADCLLVNAGSGLATLGAPSSAGVPKGAVADTITIPFNDLSALSEVFVAHGSEIAVVCVEPMAANMGLVLPKSTFLPLLRDLCTTHGALLLFDEVMTGFRIARGGAAETFGVMPDLWAFGKIIGGGLPAAAYGGRQDVMSHISPKGKAYQAGTLSGNPLAMTAGLKTLEVMESENTLEKLENLGKQLDAAVAKHLSQSISENRLCYVRKASFFCFFFGSSKIPQNFQDVSAMNMKTFSKVYHALLESGIYLGPSGFEVGFLSAAHDPSDLEKLVSVIASAIEK